MIEQLKTLREFVEAYSPSRNPSGAEALAALTKLEAMAVAQEPVAFVQTNSDGEEELVWSKDDELDGWLYEYEPLYAAPVAQQPQAEAVRSEQEIVDQTEELAAMLMSWAFNHEAADPSTKMRESNHPFAERSWEMACRVQEFLTATDPENAVAELDGREDEAPQQAEAVPPGYVLVPVKLTSAMFFAWTGTKVFDEGQPHERYQACYRAMINAAIAQQKGGV